MKMGNNLIKQGLILLTLMPACSIQSGHAQNMDNTSNIAFWTSGGYSCITNGVPETNMLGGTGMALGGGYELHYDHFALQTGLELIYGTSRMNRNDFIYTQSMQDSEGSPYQGYFEFKNIVDQQKMINVGVPLMFGYQSVGNFYFLLGGKVLFHLYGSSITSTNVTSKAYYGNIIGDDDDGIFSEIPTHGLTTERRSVRNSLRLKNIFIASIETGFFLTKPNHSHATNNHKSIRLALFADYGFSPISDMSEDLIVNISKTGEYKPAINGFLYHNVQSAFLNTLFIGVKFTTVFCIKKKYDCKCEGSVKNNKYR